MPKPLLLAALLTLALARLSSAVEPLKPNVVVIFSDDQRADTIRALGNSHIDTPHLDSLVKRGTSFTRAYCMGGMQGAVCVPSRAMFLSGRSLFRIHEQFQGVDTWPEQFASSGYATFITGKWHNGPDSLVRVFASGQAIFLGGMGDPYKLPLHNITADLKLAPREPASGQHAVQTIAENAIGFIERRDKERPFLLYVAMEAPHDPRVAPAAFHEKYNAVKPPLPADYLPQHPFDNGEMTVRDELLAPWPRTPEVIRQHLADYYASISFMDEQIGRILAALKVGDLEQNTIVVFASDQGLAVGSHGLMGKQNLYDSAMRVPLVIAGPKLPSGVQSNAMCYLFDVFPTLGALCDIDAPAGSEGRSILNASNGKPAAGRPHIVTAYRNVQRAIRDDRWKLIRYPLVDKTQLFDLKSDPHEMHNLAEESEHAAKAAELLALLEKEAAAFGDRAPLKVANPMSGDWTPPKNDPPKPSLAPRTKPT